ncbi:MAG: UvrB/UvrC motif-containing protein, partial [Dethiobacter sp.]|nr:UvrB/UvrC motif-containing protein [Dethiobacter sp.]
QRKETIAALEKEMKKAARELEFERAARLRDQLFQLRKAGKEDEYNHGT